ncbi:MAG: hypothetical protein AAFV59_17470, partial [Pseudomonadota bacterium]
MIRPVLAETGICKNSRRLQTSTGSVFLLGALLLAAMIWLAPSAASEAAVYSGSFTCESKYPGTKSDIGTGQCWSCPSTHPHRTVFGVNGNKACEQRAGIKWA